MKKLPATLTMRLDAREREELEQRAARERQPISTFVRQAALAVARSDLAVVTPEEAPRPAA